MTGGVSGKRIGKAKPKGGKGSKRGYNKNIKQVKTKAKTRNRFIDKKLQRTALAKVSAPADAGINRNRGVHEAEPESVYDIT
jgi:hypothetical protein